MPTQNGSRIKGKIVRCVREREREKQEKLERGSKSFLDQMLPNHQIPVGGRQIFQELPGSL